MRWCGRRSGRVYVSVLFPLFKSWASARSPKASNVVRVPMLVALRIFCARSVSVLVAVSACAIHLRFYAQTATYQCSSCRWRRSQDMTCCQSSRGSAFLMVCLRETDGRLADTFRMTTETGCALASRSSGCRRRRHQETTTTYLQDPLSWHHQVRKICSALASALRPPPRNAA